eukprot:s1320_g8.t1
MATVENSDTEEEDRPASPGAIRRVLERQPKPTVATEYNVEDANFWTHRHIPVGSVISFPALDPEGNPLGIVALRVAAVDSLENGLWLGVVMVGSESKEHRPTLQKMFGRGKTPIHTCYETDGICPEADEHGLHLRQFRWFPPGDFAAPWVTTHGARSVKEGLAQAAAAAGRKPALRRPAAAREDSLKGLSETERRLARLKGDGLGAVKFAGNASRRKRPKAGDAQRSSAPGGTPGRDEGSSSALEPSRALVKIETVDLTRRSKSPRRKPKQKVGDSFMTAARTHQLAVKEEKTRDRSRSRRRKKRRHRSRHRSDSRSSSPSPESSHDSSDSSLVPPLKRRSRKEPGSVFRLLEQQVFEYLSQDGLLEGEEYSVELGRNRPRFTTYFQLALKPRMEPKSRDCRELALLARVLDLLREGKLEEVADVISARLIAIDTAQRQGWGSAQFLEIYTGEDQGTVPPHILLAAQKHGRQVEKAGGKGSWPRSGGWSSEWVPDQTGGQKGKGAKGKGKKGKGKPKGGKGKWQNWGEAEKDAKKPEAAAT